MQLFQDFQPRLRSQRAIKQYLAGAEGLSRSGASETSVRLKSHRVFGENAFLELVCVVADSTE